MIKVALIMGVSGACRCCELTNLKISDVEDRGAYLIVPTTTIRSGTDNNYKLLIIPLVE
ncbi:unnamed protein product [Tenebrio molitor]|nr:unnamed protein product [Tenebrio molitor]